MLQVRRDGLQVDPPGVVTVVLHQVSEQELTHRSVLKDAQKLFFSFVKSQNDGDTSIEFGSVGVHF